MNGIVASKADGHRPLRRPALAEVVLICVFAESTGADP
jgi:hypothetical protein